MEDLQGNMDRVFTAKAIGDPGDWGICADYTESSHDVLLGGYGQEISSFMALSDRATHLVHDWEAEWVECSHKAHVILHPGRLRLSVEKSIDFFLKEGYNY